MNTIKTLADELRETIRDDNRKNKQSEHTPPKLSKSAKPVKIVKAESDHLETRTSFTIHELLDQIAGFQLTGNEKVMIRLDDHTVLLLKQLKLACGIDMNKLIAYSLQSFLESRPDLVPHIKHILKSF